jgi:hypothetical protein
MTARSEGVYGQTTSGFGFTCTHLHPFFPIKSASIEKKTGLELDDEKNVYRYSLVSREKKKKLHLSIVICFRILFVANQRVILLEVGTVFIRTTNSS